MISPFRPEPEETPEKPAAMRVFRIRSMPAWLLTCAGAAGDPGEGGESVVKAPVVMRQRAAPRSTSETTPGRIRLSRRREWTEVGSMPARMARAGGPGGLRVVAGDDTTSEGAYCTALNR